MVMCLIVIGLCNGAEWFYWIEMKLSLLWLLRLVETDRKQELKWENNYTGLILHEITELLQRLAWSLVALADKFSRDMRAI